MENLETKTVEDIWQRSMYMRSKMLNGLEVLMNVDISGSNATEKELIYERDKMKLILKDLNIPFYDPIMIIKKTEGRMAEDNFWIKIEL